LPCIRAGGGNGLAIAGIEAKWIEVAVQEPAFFLVDHIERSGLVCFHRGNRLQEHRFGFVGGAELASLLSESRCIEHQDCGESRSDRDCAHLGAADRPSSRHCNVLIVPEHVAARRVRDQWGL
jgi:hypothetical protein